MQMLTKIQRMGAIKRPTQWLESIFITEHDMYNGLEKARQETRVYQHDYQTLNGEHGVEYMLMIEVDNNAEVPGFTADAFEASYDDYSVGYEDA